MTQCFSRRLSPLLLVLAVACASGAGDDVDADLPRGDASVPDGATWDGAPLDCSGLATCGATCADLDVDPDNCGACGRTCIIPGADAACDLGECIIASCDRGFFDVDGDPANGCELEDACEAGLVCTTSCGSAGTTACTAGVASCTAPPESCNAADDDCNGECDEGALGGCRVGIHRSFGYGHLYTTDSRAAATAPYSVERTDYFHVYSEPVPGTRPLFLCRKSSGMHLLTAQTNCEMAGARIATLGYWSPTEICGAVPLYRLYNAATGNHFFTLSAAEHESVAATPAYVSEGVAGWVWPSP